jgi:hypothetical protein
VTPIARDLFFTPGETVADNEDASFTIVQSGRSYAWRTWLKEKQQPTRTHYQGGNLFAHISHKWTTAVNPLAHGLYTRSLIGKRAKDGKAKVTWHARIEEEGMYDLYAQVPVGVLLVEHTVMAGGNVYDLSTREASFQHYTISTADGPVEVSVDVEPRDWVHLGTFRLSAGEQQVTLDDSGVANQVIVADAVKWVRVKE